MADIVVKRWEDKLVSDSTRVIARFFVPGDRFKTRRVIERILALPEDVVQNKVRRLCREFHERHRAIENIFRKHFEEVLHRMATEPADQGEDDRLLDGMRSQDLNDDHRLLIGSYFTSEYSVEAAAFFNPSIVEHPDQTGLAAEEKRILLSFRAVGEGHISSIVFRSGVLRKGDIALDPATPYVGTPAVVSNPAYDRKCFLLKLAELGAHNVTAKTIVERLSSSFTYEDLEREIAAHREEFRDNVDMPTIETMQWLADANYEIRFDPESDLSERVIFPVSETESHGMEDARFVRFMREDGEAVYYATYTAFSGNAMVPQMIETRDFLSFRIITLNGEAAAGKGLALFPRMVHGSYMMIGRQDGENLYLMRSDNIHFWHEKVLLQAPCEPWELVQIGNCGSPLETDQGWLMLTHGVGPVRRYSIGAMLLDLRNPAVVIGRLREPLLIPTAAEREGYVPNVVYTCGALIHAGRLVVPYAMSDTASGIATVSLDELLSLLLESGP